MYPIGNRKTGDELALKTQVSQLKSILLFQAALLFCFGCRLHKSGYAHTYTE